MDFDKFWFRNKYYKNPPVEKMKSIDSRNVCLSAPGNPDSRWTGDFWLRSISLILANLNAFFFIKTVSMICCVYFFLLRVFGSLVHSWGVSSGRVCGCSCWHKWQVTSDTQHVTCDSYNVTYDMWHMTHATWHMILCSSYFVEFFVRFFLFLSVSVHFCLFWYRCSYLHTLRDSVSIPYNYSTVQ